MKNNDPSEGGAMDSNDQELSRGEYVKKQRKQFDQLVENDCFLRPHIRFPFSEDEFNKALESAINGDSTTLESKDRDLVVSGHLLDLGYLDLSIAVRQMIFWEHQVGNNEHDAVELSLYVGSSDAEAAYEHYSTEPPELIKRIRSGNRAAQQHVTLLRDISPGCRDAVLKMRELVQNHSELVWGGEPELTTTDGAYGFSTPIYYRPCEN
ncbi:hypothetical protein EXE48_14355 [Halorubrum sp. ASP1]|uniref:hypothetical protein n=1 Tax=Halorubrum sp. ASP1 TaxID=2518114 RepID=UPI0010F46A60|nr:hypothetical protein [Halorubrum sp. ASP1]TKX59689.1 hypothetical protein EXE48_14355 [Halorubrum sp. ASP1]